jgi:hypothetical protein
MRFVLRVAATIVLLTWAAGVASFRGGVVAPEDIAFMVCLGAFLLLRKQESQPAVDHATARRMALVLALGTAIFALVIGVLFEVLVAAFRDGQTAPFWLRALWHPACAFVGTFLGQWARRWP